MDSTLKQVVQERYGEAARRAVNGDKGACCGTGSSCGCDPISSDLYDALATSTLPEKAVLASLG